MCFCCPFFCTSNWSMLAIQTLKDFLGVAEAEVRSLTLLYSGVVCPHHLLNKYILNLFNFYAEQNIHFWLLPNTFLDVLQCRNVDALAIYFGEDPTRCPFEQGLNLLVIVNLYFVNMKQEWAKKIHVISCSFQLQCIWMVPRMQVEQFRKRWLCILLFWKILNCIICFFHSIYIYSLNLYSLYISKYLCRTSFLALLSFDAILVLDTCKIDLKLYPICI